MEDTCVYQYFDHRGQILYVGITGRGIRRSHEHSRTKDWWSSTSGCHIEHFATRREALAREAYLIAAYKPPYNTQGTGRRLTMTEIKQARNSAGEVISDMAWQCEMVDLDNACQSRDWPNAIRIWMSLPTKFKKLTGCIRCKARDNNNGPMCKLCHHEYVGGMTRTVRREQHTQDSST